MRSLLILMPLLVSLLEQQHSPGCSIADIREELRRLSSKDISQSDQPLCGAFAACNAARSLGVDCAVEQFIKRRFISHCGGSTELDICSMVESLGLIGTVRENLSVLDLQSIGQPFIAHVRSSPDVDRLSHWVTVVPQGSTVLVLSESQQPKRVTNAEFSAVWGGAGIFVSEKKPPVGSLMLSRVSTFVTMLSLGVMVATGIGVCSFRVPVAEKPLARQLFAVAVISCIVGSYGLILWGDLSNFKVGLSSAIAHSYSHFEECALDELIQASESEEFILVDARLARDYELGSLDGAVNIPVNSSYWSLSAHLSEIPRDTPFIVFCQSAHCDYDTSVARRLRSFGFRNVTVCESGWREVEEFRNGKSR